MGWREKMGAKVKTECPTINTINPKKGGDRAFSSIFRINSMGSGNEKGGYAIPSSEKAFAEDERKAIIHFDGRGSDEWELIEKVKEVFQGELIPQNG